MSEDRATLPAPAPADGKASGEAPPGAAAAVTRIEVEDFLFLEAALLDEWRLDDWLGLFEEGATYRVPCTDLMGGDPRTDQFLISDDYDLLRARVKRLKSKMAHAENPHSRTRRLITNVRLGNRTEDSIEVYAAFLVYRIRDGLVDPYVGRYEHVLSVRNREIRFRHRTSVLEVEALRPGGRISFIL